VKTAVDAMPGAVAPARNETWLLPVLLAIDSLHFVFARIAHDVLDPRVSAGYALGVAALIVGLYGIATRRLSLAIGRAHWKLFATIGLLVAFSTQINYSVIDTVDPGAASLLSQASTFYAIGFGVLWLGERFTRWQALGAGLAVIGALVVAFQARGDVFRYGSLLLLMGSLAYQLHAALSKRYAGGINLLNFFFYRLLFTAFFLLLGAGAQRALVVPDARGLGIVVLVACVDIVLSRSLYYRALRRINISVFAVVMTLSPVLTALWSYALFGSTPSQQQLIGGAIVLAGVLILALKRGK
jgi:drug/metabolite transporter (DMT)-like permease